jgi:hypothetical protein
LKIALEGIQLMPTSPLLQRLFEIENFDPEESDQLPGRVEMPVTSGSAQAPDFARTEALFSFDAVRRTKRTPLEMDICVDVQVWRLPDSGQRCRRGLGCDQMMPLFSLAMLPTLKGYILFRTSKL